MKSIAILDNDKGREQLGALADKHGLQGEQLGELLAAVARHSGMLRRRGLFQQFDAILGEAKD